MIVVNYEDAEKTSLAVVYVTNRTGEPIAFENLQSAIDVEKAYDYKAFADEYRRSYQQMMKEFLNIGYVYDVNADGYQKSPDGVTLAPLNSYLGKEMGITYLFEAQVEQYQITVCDIIDALYMDNIQDYCFNRFGYTKPERTEMTVQNDDLQDVFRFCTRKTQIDSYKAMIDTKYYIDVVTDETDLTKVGAFLESISLEWIDVA